MSVFTPSNKFPIIIVLLFIVLFWTRYVAPESVCGKFVGYSLHVSSHRRVRTRACWFTHSVSCLVYVAALCSRLNVPLLVIAMETKVNWTCARLSCSYLWTPSLHPKVCLFLISIIMYRCHGWLLRSPGWRVSVEFVVLYRRNERRGLAWFWMEVWKLRG
jgi:hypothetical protein